MTRLISHLLILTLLWSHTCAVFARADLNMLHMAYDPTEPDALNHFNRLMTVQNQVSFGAHVDQPLPEDAGEVVEEEGVDIYLPFSTVATFAGNVRDGVNWVQGQMTAQQSAAAVDAALDATCKAIADAHKETEDSHTGKKHAHETATDADANNDAGINDADDYNAEIDAYFEAMDRAKADDVNTDVGGLRNELFDLSATGTGFGTIVGTAGDADAVQIRMSPTSTYFDGEMSKAAIDLNSIDPTTDPAGFYDAQARYDFWENAYDTRQFHVQGARETVAATRDVAADVARNWKGYGLAAAESLPYGIGTGVEAAHHGVDIYKGNQTVLGAAAIMGTEAAVGYVGGKAVKLASRGVNKVVGYFAKRLADSRGGGTIGGATQNLMRKQDPHALTGLIDTHVSAETAALNHIRGSVQRHRVEVSAWAQSRTSRKEGLAKWHTRPDAQTLEIAHNVGDRGAFTRKLNALQDLADRGKLVKTASVRDDSITFQYRKALLDRAEQKWKISNPDKYESMRDRIFNLDADHLHELQLGGLDHRSALTMLDKSVNRSFGAQIRPQLARMPDGAPITKIVEKAGKKK